MAFQTATIYGENLIIDIGHNIANHKGEFDIGLFSTNGDHFQQLSHNNFQIVMNKISDDKEVTEVPECIYVNGYQTFTDYQSYAYNEH